MATPTSGMGKQSLYKGMQKSSKGIQTDEYSAGAKGSPNAKPRPKSGRRVTGTVVSR